MLPDGPLSLIPMGLCCALPTGEEGAAHRHQETESDEQAREPSGYLDGVPGGHDGTGGRDLVRALRHGAGSSLCTPWVRAIYLVAACTRSMIGLAISRMNTPMPA